jgi:hypothetical protein
MITGLETMGRQELRRLAKEHGIKYSKMSLFQIREALKDVKPSKKKDEPKERKQRTGTKMQSALKIMEDNPDLPRKSILKLFQDKAKLTLNGSATYYALCQKRLKKK